jgi:hypothetical protein
MPSKEKKVVPMVELTFDENEEFGEGITAMSVVTRPAIKENFVYMSEQFKLRFEKADKDPEKRLLIGPALIPDLPIYRSDEDGEYYAFMRKETIESLAYSFIRLGRQNNATLEHAVKAQGMSIVESWLIEDSEKDKSTALGMNYPKGTWMIAMKVENDDVWNEFIKTGKLKGFSIEGLLQEKRTEQNVQRFDEMSDKQRKRIEAAIQALKRAVEHHGKV